MPSLELNLDGLPGPTHGFGGLSFGNLASTSNKSAVSNPRAAALQGLAKMRLVASLGLPQGILPPHPRPNLHLLRSLGFSGTDKQVLEKVWSADPDLLLVASSSSAMWTANAATICPSADSTDGKLHLTPANLAHQFHRAQEASQTARALRAIFPDPALFSHHPPLPTHSSLGDEGAANHIRLGHASTGLQLFVHGDPPPVLPGKPAEPGPTRFPARQTYCASRAVARLNAVRPEGIVFLQQNPAAIDAGAFHNDVVSVGSGGVLLLHEHAYALPAAALQALLGPDVTLLVVPESELSLADAVKTYLFNSQLVPLPDGSLALIAPADVRDHRAARGTADRLIAAGTALKHIHYVDLHQSMRNGGGPACLRLRIPLTAPELAATHSGVLLTPALLASLEAWANKHYRDHLTRQDLADPQLLDESQAALDALTQILDLPSLYDFQC